jgi:hypothetical protein
MGNRDGNYFELTVDETLLVYLGIEGIEHSGEGNSFTDMV